MKFLHLSDLHLGKKVNDFSMLEEQKNALSQALDLVKNQKIDFIIIAGDVFDKQIPNIQAIELFSNFLYELEKLNKKVFIISGNHDNLERLSYLSNLVERANIFFSKPFEGKLQKIEVDNKTNVFLLPFLNPVQVKKFYKDSEIKNHNDAIKTVIQNTKLDKTKINILVLHQFVSGVQEEIIFSQSEEKSVAGLDMVSSDLFKYFDYTALGHLHCPQKAGSENIRYAGSLLKYSFSEINQNKVFTIVEIKDKNDIKISFEKIKFIHEMKEYKGYIEEFLDEKFYSKIKTDDYIHFILLDEEVIDAKKKLSLIYPNIMILEFDNSFTRSSDFSFDFKNLKDKTILEHFYDFYKIQTEDEIDKNKKEILENLIKEGV